MHVVGSNTFARAVSPQKDFSLPLRKKLLERIWPAEKDISHRSNEWPSQSLKEDLLNVHRRQLALIKKHQSSTLGLHQQSVISRKPMNFAQLQKHSNL